MDSKEAWKVLRVLEKQISEIGGQMPCVIYPDMFPLLVATILDLRSKVEELQTEVGRLQAEVHVLKYGTTDGLP